MSYSDNKIRVVVLYHYVAHYREPVFAELCSQEHIEYLIFADIVSNMKSLKVIDGSEGSCSHSILKKWTVVRNFWMGQHFLWQRGVLDIAFRKDVDAVVLLGNMYFLSNWVLTLLCKVTGKPVLMWTHGVRKKEKGLKSIIRNIFYKLSNALLLYGNRAKKILIEKGFKEDSLEVIYNSLDFEQQNTIAGAVSERELVKFKLSLVSGADQKLVVATGRITEDKKFDLLVEAAKFLAEKGMNIKYVLIGDGPHKSVLHEQVCRYGLEDNFIFFGACYDETVLAQIMLASDVAVVPGNIGLSAIHALTYGVPVITHDNFDTHKPEFEAIVDGFSGSFFKCGNVADLAKKIEYWSFLQDRTSTADNCKKIIKEFYNPIFQVKAINSKVEELCR